MHCLVKNYGGNSLQQLAKETYAVKKVIFSNNHHKKKYMKKTPYKFDTRNYIHLLKQRDICEFALIAVKTRVLYVPDGFSEKQVKQYRKILHFFVGRSGAWLDNTALLP